MATKIDKETQALQYQFPIIATNLRALVSSWLPPARESSPDDGEDASRAIQGRPERLALGATVSGVQAHSSQAQNRMDRKMGVRSLTNGLSKTTSKLHSAQKNMNGSDKRKLESSDSEEDSKSKLITKSSSRKGESNQCVNKKTKSGKGFPAHEAIAHTPSLHGQSPASEVSPPANLPLPAKDSPQLGSSTLHTSLPKPPELPTFAEILAECNAKSPKETDEERRKRLKKERKKERKRLKKLEKAQKRENFKSKEIENN